MSLTAGSSDFIKWLIGVKFLEPESFVQWMQGEDVNGFNLTINGFKKPIIVLSKSGLRMKVPLPSFSVRDVVEFSDPNILIDVIDVALQADMQLPLGEFVESFLRKPRERILNVLSFEYSNTKLALLVHPPHVVKELSLVDNCWPEISDDEDQEEDLFLKSNGTSRPNVQKYCLMSMGNSYTDFHIDFGGSSVWYHILWGSKVFYIIPPTSENLKAYWKWNKLPNSSKIFFPDTLPSFDNNRRCKKPQVAQLNVHAGETILIPAGWIHAVYTPCDSLVFGGNFLTQLSIPLQLSVYCMEMKQGVEERFLFPYFEKLHWYAADVILGRLTNNLNAGEQPSEYQLIAAQHLISSLCVWYETRKQLPKNKQFLYLPPASYIQHSCIDIICKLEKIIRHFNLKPSHCLTNYQKHPIGSDYPPTFKNSSDIELSAKKCSCPTKMQRNSSYFIDNPISDSQLVTNLNTKSIHDYKQLSAIKCKQTAYHARTHSSKTVNIEKPSNRQRQYFPTKDNDPTWTNSSSSTNNNATRKKRLAKRLKL